MLGASRTSEAQAREALASRSDQDGFDAVGAELLSVATLLSSSAQLRSVLTDTQRDGAERGALARSVLGGKVGELTADIMAEAASLRWARAGDLVDTIENLGVEATLIMAEKAGRADTVEDELFRVERLVAGDRDLAEALTQSGVTDAAKASLLAGILDGEVSFETAALVRHVVAHPRGRRPQRALAELVDAAAKRRERLLAKVRVVAALTDEQHERLAAVLERIYRRPVDLQVQIDPDVRGGAVVQVGDEVIDGSVAHRLDNIRRLMGAN
ncbi:MAG TPA: F0F1 ATP synthase subunit delta [Jiangellaceae bacterium]